VLLIAKFVMFFARGYGVRRVRGSSPTVREGLALASGATSRAGQSADKSAHSKRRVLSSPLW